MINYMNIDTNLEKIEQELEKPIDKIAKKNMKFFVNQIRAELGE